MKNKKVIIILFITCLLLVGCSNTKASNDLYTVTISDLDGSTDTIFSDKISFGSNYVTIHELDGTEYITSYNNVIIKK